MEKMWREIWQQKVLGTVKNKKNKIKLNLTITGSIFLSLLYTSLPHSFPLSRFLCIFSVEWICLEVKRERERERERERKRDRERGWEVSRNWYSLEIYSIFYGWK